MAKRKAKGRNTEDIEEKSQANRSDNVNENFTKRTLPLLVIGVAVVVLIFVVISLSSANRSKSTAQNGQLATPATGVEKFIVGQAAIPKVAISTFKLVELSGPDCVNTILTEFRKLNGIATVRADYTNKLLEVKYDPEQVTPDKLVDALKKANHPGQPTNQFFGAN